MRSNNIYMRHNLSYTDQNIDIRQCLRLYCDSVNACIFKYFLFLLLRFMGKKPSAQRKSSAIAVSFVVVVVVIVSKQKLSMVPCR